MSSTHEMPAASSSIIVVDSSGNVKSSTAPQSQQQLQRQLQNQQVIVNDEFLNADGLVASGVNYINANDLINNTRIIKFVTEEEAAIIEQEQYHQDDQIYGTVTPQPPAQGISNPNSKVHVISNVTIVSKPQLQTPNAISLVNSRNLPSSGTFVNSYISKQNSGKLYPSNQNHQQQQILAKHVQASGQVTQKITVPRIVTRVQTISSQQQSSNNIVVSRNASVVPISNVIESQQVQKHQHSMQLVPVNKANNLRNRTIATSSSSVKLMHSAKPSGIKAIQAPPQQSHLSKGKTSKIFKSYSSTPSSLSSSYDQQHQIKNISVQSTSINNNNNTINTSKMLQHYQHLTPQRAITNSVYIQGTTVPKVNKSKYMIQKQSVSQVMLPIQQTTQKSSYQQHSQSIVAASGSNIKYVNAQGSVIASSARVRTVMQQSGGTSYQQTQSTVYVENTMSPVIPQELQATSSVTKCSVDDVVIVNGTHMSDEMSARILQSLSKNSTYNSTTRSTTNQSIKMTQQATFLKSTTTEQLSVLNPPHSMHNVQQQQVQVFSHRVSSEAVSAVSSVSSVSSVKFGPEYFRVK